MTRSKQSKRGTARAAPASAERARNVRGRNARPEFAGRLMARLTRALDWFDNSLQNVVASHGFEPFHRTQSLIIVHIAMGVDRPADIAREMGLTRQNVHHMGRTLLEAGVIESVPDESDPRRSRYRLSDRAAELREIALAAVVDLERVLERRVGVRRVDALRGALGADWGPEIEDRHDLEANLRDPRRQ